MRHYENGSEKLGWQTIRTYRRPYRTAALIIPITVIVGMVSMLVGPLAAAAAAAVPALMVALRYPFALSVAALIGWPLLAALPELRVPGGLTDISFERIALAAAAGVTLIAVPRSRFLTLTVSPWVALYFLASVIWIVLWGAVGTSLVVLLSIVTVYWLTRSHLENSHRIYQLLAAITIAAVAISWTGFYERLLDLEYSAFDVTTGTAAGTRYLDVPGGRATGVLGNPAIYGAIAASGLLCSMILWLKATKRSTRLLTGLAAVNLSYAVFVSYTRSAWLAGLVGVVVALILNRDLRHQAILVSVILVVGASFGLFFAVDAPDATALSDRLTNVSTVEGRLDRAAYSLGAFAEAPLVGQGPGVLNRLIAARFPGGGFDTSHNTYLTLAVNGGLLLLVPLVALALSWLRMATRRQVARTPSATRDAIAAAAGIVSVYLVSGTFLDLANFPYFTAIFFASGALIEQVHSMSEVGERGLM